MKLKKPEDYGYVVKNNICLFQKGPLSQWWGGFAGQTSDFDVSGQELSDYTTFSGEADLYLSDDCNIYTFNCCEQWMMAVKALVFDDIEAFKAIMKEKHPQAQKDLGRSIKNYNEQDWKARRYEVVLDGNYHKYSQNDELRDFLYQFPRHTIFAEASWFDSIWGIGLSADNPDALDIYKWKGLNLLGEVQQQIRRCDQES